MSAKKIFVILFLAANLLLPAAAMGAWEYTDDGPDLGFEYGEYTGLANRDARFTAAQIIRTALGVLGTVDLAIILYAGFLWMTAGGNEDKVSEAKKWLYGSVVGMAIILSAYSVTSYVINNLIKATTTADYSDYDDPRNDPRFYTQ